MHLGAVFRVSTMYCVTEIVYLIIVCVRSNRSQHAVGEVDTNDRDVTHWQNTDTAVSRLIARLKDVTDKLQNAYNGLDVSRSSAGQYGESVLVTWSVYLFIKIAAL